MRYRLTTFAVLAIALTCWIDLALGAEPPRIALETSAGNETIVVARGVPATANASLQVFVASAPNEKHAADRSPLLGESFAEDGRVVFAPRFPLAPGIEYEARLRFARDDGEELHEARFLIPKPESPPTVVERVYPSGDVLPENQLKFYLHFSAPMSRGQAYDHLRLIDEKGDEVFQPFLELPEELWDASGRRLTLFFDPGRIKHGLKPREDLGPTLIAGGQYSLVIDAGWSDAQGSPLAEPFRKVFKAADPDEEQPSLDRWRIETPPAGGRQPLVVRFDEPLDHAMLERVIEVVDADGEVVEGEVKVAEDERLWMFTPSSVWSSGDFALVVDAALEDRAGNSLAKPFEVDVFEQVDRQQKSKLLRAPFSIAPAR